MCISVIGAHSDSDAGSPVSKLKKAVHDSSGLRGNVHALLQTLYSFITLHAEPLFTFDVSVESAVQTKRVFDSVFYWERLGVRNISRFLAGGFRRHIGILFLIFPEPDPRD